MKQQLSNTFTHLFIGTLAGFAPIAIDTILSFIPNSTFSFGIFYSIVWFLIMIQWERYQKNSSQSPCYWKIKWLDCIVDIIAGNIGFNIVYWMLPKLVGN